MFKVALEFETIDDAENWIAAYLDGGGEQTCGYCRPRQIYLESQYEIKDKSKTHKCQNCYHECNEEDIVNT